MGPMISENRNTSAAETAVAAAPLTVDSESVWGDMRLPPLSSEMSRDSLVPDPLFRKLADIISEEVAEARAGAKEVSAAMETMYAFVEQQTFLQQASQIRAEEQYADMFAGTKGRGADIGGRIAAGAEPQPLQRGDSTADGSLNSGYAAMAA